MAARCALAYNVVGHAYIAVPIVSPRYTHNITIPWWLLVSLGFSEVQLSYGAIAREQWYLYTYGSARR